jgi:hypothetical protein
MREGKFLPAPSTGINPRNAAQMRQSQFPTEIAIREDLIIAVKAQKRHCVIAIRIKDLHQSQEIRRRAARSRILAAI